MNLYDKLLEAINEGRGLKMRAILIDAEKSGVSREDALSVLLKLYEKFSCENNVDAEDAVVDYMDILKFYCHPNNYIWKPEESQRRNEPPPQTP